MLVTPFVSIDSLIDVQPEETKHGIITTTVLQDDEHDDSERKSKSKRMTFLERPESEDDNLTSQQIPQITHTIYIYLYSALHIIIVLLFILLYIIQLIKLHNQSISATHVPRW